VDNSTKFEHRLMRWSLALPAEQLWPSGDDLRAVAAAAEAAGADAVWASEHPFPTTAWLEAGGHHAVDPMVALSYAASATTTLRLHVNAVVAAYRNPYLTARSVSSLDALSGGRVILGVVAGYQEGEFRALGAPFDDRARRVEADVGAMRAAWTGEPVGPDANVMRPTPRGDVPVWIGGNSRSAMKRAAAVGDGWMPFPAPEGVARAVGTAAIASVDELRARIAEVHVIRERLGRGGPFDVCATPRTHPFGRGRLDTSVLRDEAAELEAAGVTWMSLGLPCRDRAELLEAIDRFGSEVV
jgi:probable F420-dependent oxidoreductase